MIELGERKGFPREKHFILTMDASVKNLPVVTYAFDIYAQSEKEAWEILKKFLRDNLERYGYQMVERGPLSDK